MKKKKIQNLLFSKKVISSLSHEKLTGGNGTHQGTDCTVCCIVDQTCPCDTYHCDTYTEC